MDSRDAIEHISDVQEWLEHDPDPETRNEMNELLTKGEKEKIQELFNGDFHKLLIHVNPGSVTIYLDCERLGTRHMRLLKDSISIDGSHSETMHMCETRGWKASRHSCGDI